MLTMFFLTSEADGEGAPQTFFFFGACSGAVYDEELRLGMTDTTCIPDIIFIHF